MERMKSERKLRTKIPFIIRFLINCGEAKESHLSFQNSSIYYIIDSLMQKDRHQGSKQLVYWFLNSSWRFYEFLDMIRNISINAISPFLF